MSLSWKKMKEILSTNENKELIIGILSILIIIWILFYLLPGVLVLLFNTFLGNLIILLVTLLIALKNLKMAIIVGLISLMLIRMMRLVSLNSKNDAKEGFIWNEQKKRDYIAIQQTNNSGIVFDTSVMEKQITNEELDYYFKHGSWPWSKKTEDLYEDAINNNVYIRQYPKVSIERAKTIYNENAILQILAQQTKEGQFLINGVEIGLDNDDADIMNSGLLWAYDSGQIKKKRPIVKCSMDNKNVLQKITPTGRDPVLSSETSETSIINIENLEKIIPGFKFLKEKCNPCSNINAIPEYNCPFELKIKENEGPISPVWEYLWFGKK